MSQFQETEGSVRRLSLEDLDDKHRQILARAISQVISTDIAEINLAQILDGLPLASVDENRYWGPLSPFHPLRKRHTELCSGILDQTRELYRNFDINIISFDSRVILAYKVAAPGSTAFNTRLIEFVAVAVHQIAAWIHKQSKFLHKGDALGTWVPSKEDNDVAWWHLFPDGHPPTFFLHPWYRDHDQYPDGVADCVGYWAEARILGGVILFDRYSPDSQVVFTHPDREGVTYRIAKLLDSQKNQLLGFLLYDGEKTSASPLPILPDMENDYRVDAEEPIGDTGVCRDLWERKSRPVARGDFRLRDVFGRVDWPQVDDKVESQRRAQMRLYMAESARREQMSPD